jgi:polyisoprenoid-binding protein YceI
VTRSATLDNMTNHTVSLLRVHDDRTIPAPGVYEIDRAHTSVEIGAASVSTGNDDRDAHLRSGDFFDVEHYPKIRFTSTAVSALPDDTWQLDGELTVRDITRPVALKVSFDGGDASPFGDERIGFSAETEINREDFGLTWNVALESGGLLVGKTVRIELAVEAIAIREAKAA